ncbi:glycosyltransferase family 2 protein [Culturomica sp.]|uniref:glycosyltransferase family 2 protein n=1 Tax=Culturomica sp. TaxID=1926652 RepID=UPI000E816F00|nr:glycosyltransferase family 2 protein [Culturomica sp.]HBO26217.1 glycosyl transferase [Culturomica sp.]
MLISVITPTYNSAQTLTDTLKSVLSQTYQDIEYIIIDGGSDEKTPEIIKQYKPLFGSRLQWYREKDKGLYDAMNKGIRMATGDVVGILNSDDFFTSNDVLTRIAEEFDKNEIDAVYGDIHFVNPGNLQKCVRYYSSSIFRPALFRFGFMPAHPSFYVKRECYEKYGLYALNYKIAADYDLLIRFLYVNRIKYKYIKMDFVTMRTGGVSTTGIKSRIILNREIVKACRKYGIYTNLFFLTFKYFYKIFELRKKIII